VSVLPIRVLGDPILRKQTVPVREVTPELRKLVADMFETMHAAKGIGLAAPQVGRTERLTVIEIEGEQLVLFNPEIRTRAGKITWEEGCLSIPEVYAKVERAAEVTVRAMGLDGQEYEVSGTELLAVCLQHEIDHLDGKLFLDKLSLLKRRAALKIWDEEKDLYPDFIRFLKPGHETGDHGHEDGHPDDERL
jgi:peptide deformylase